MIKFCDTANLALVKFRSHKVKSLLTILVPGVIFGILIAATMLADGFMSAVETSRSGHLASRYIVAVSSANSLSMTNNDYLLSAPVKSEVEQKYSELIQDKKSAAQRLNLVYDPSSEQPPYIDVGDGSVVPNTASPIVQQTLAERWRNVPAVDDNELRAIGQQYNAMSYFQAISYVPGGVNDGSVMHWLKDGQERFYDMSDESETTAYQSDLSVLDLSSFETMPTGLVGEFMFDNNGGWTADGGSIPIMISLESAEQLLGLDRLDKDATVAQKSERLSKVKNGISGKQVSFCYRNKSSNDLLQLAIAQRKLLDNGAKPEGQSVIYQLPDPGSCDNVTILQDNRTEAERIMDQNQQAFDREFNGYVDPISKKVTFTVVGVLPSSNRNSNSSEAMASLDDLLSNLTGVSGFNVPVVPQELLDQMSDEAMGYYDDIFTKYQMYFFGNDDGVNRYVEFASADDAQRFIDEQSCEVDYDGVCKPTGRKYSAYLTFSNSSAIDDLEQEVERYLRLAAVGVAIICSIVMVLIMMRTIADDKHETAVFRAIGFKRIDVVGIYVLYGLILTLISIVIAIAIGLIIAVVVNNLVSPWLSVQLAYAFASFDMSMVNVVMINPSLLAKIALIMLAVGMVSAAVAVLPLLRSSITSALKED